MFGNRAGWGISAVLVGLVVLVVFQLARLNTVTAPSRGALDKKGTYALKLESRPEMLDPIQLPFDPTTVLPSMTKSGDAGPLYRAAMAEHDKAPNLYDTARGRLKSTDPAQYPAFAPLIEARDLDKMNLFAATPDDVINYKRFEPAPIQAIAAVGLAAVQLSQLLPEDQKATALQLAEAGFSLGVKMCQERVRWSEFDSGQRLITEGCFQIGALDPSRKAAAKAAMDAMGKFVRERCMPFAFVVTSIDSNVMGRTAGDIFYILKHGKERMWRVEAALKMGHYKYNAGEPGNAADQRFARIYAKRLMNDESDDRLVRAAAKQAYDLTAEQYQLIGSG